MREKQKTGSAREIERERFGTDVPPPPPFRPERPADCLDKIMQRCGMDDKLWEHTLSRDWKDLVGDQVAAHTRPGLYHNSRLTIYVDSSPWLRALEMDFKDMIKKNLQEKYGSEKIGKLSFAIDPDF